MGLIAKKKIFFVARPKKNFSFNFFFFQVWFQNRRMKDKRQRIGGVAWPFPPQMLMLNPFAYEMWMKSSAMQFNEQNANQRNSGRLLVTNLIKIQKNRDATATHR